MGVFDQAAKRATLEEPTGLLRRLAVLAKVNWRFTTFTDTQTSPKPTERDQTADKVAVVENVDKAGELWLVPIEFQSGHAPEKLDDLLVEAAQFRRNLRHGEERKDKYVVFPVLVYLASECPASESCLDMRSPSGHGLLHAPLIWEVAKDSAAGTLDDYEQGKIGWGMLFFVPLMAGADAPEIARRWRGVVDLLPPRHRADVARFGLLFAGLAKRGQLWGRILEGWAMQTESALFNEWMAEACDKRGRETWRVALLRLLRSRYKVAVPADIAEVIDQQPSEQLLIEWFDQVEAIPTIDEFRAYLRRRP